MNTIVGFSVAIVAGSVIGIITDEIIIGNKHKKKIRKLKESQSKLQEFYLILLQWIRVKQEKKSLVDYFIRNGISTIAIYGMRELGEALIEELRDTGIIVKYGIDKNADNIFAEVDMYTPEESLEPVDAIVVTAVHYYDEIEQDLKEKTNAKIVSIEDVVWEA